MYTYQSRQGFRLKMRLRSTVEAKKENRQVKIIKETYRDFAENTSIHGLKYTVTEEIEATEKIFWLVVVIAGFCGAAYMTVLFWERYTSNPTRITILSSYTPANTIEFPAVTICNLNRILESKIDQFLEKLDLQDPETTSTLRRTIPQLLAYTHPNQVDYNTTELKSFQRILDRNSINTTFLLRSVTQDCKDMLVYCSWNSEEFDCLDQFSQSLTVDGYCCSFNYFMGKVEVPMMTAYNGIGSGLNVILDPMLQGVQYSSLYSSGFKVIIHDGGEYPGIQSITKVVPINSFAFLEVSASKLTCSEDVKSLPISQRHCLLPKELVLELDTDDYSSSNCLTQCNAYYFYEACGCVPFYFSFIGKPICDATKIPCLHLASINDTGTKKCDCMSQCEDVSYSVITSSIDFERDLFEMTMMPHKNHYMTNDSIVLNVFYLRQVQETLLRDTLTSTIYLLSSFGGVYSLFMGCSLITIVEVIYYCFCRYFVNLRLSRKAEPLSQAVSHRGNHFNYNNYSNNVFLP